jgi:hypothetical protein
MNVVEAGFSRWRKARFFVVIDQGEARADRVVPGSSER